MEPTPQSYQGCLRLIDLATKLNVKYVVVINKYDLNREFSQKIEHELGNSVIGKIPYSDEVVKSYVEMVPVISRESKISKELECIFEELLKRV